MRMFKHGDGDETLTFEHDSLMIEHRQLYVDLEWLLLSEPDLPNIWRATRAAAAGLGREAPDSARWLARPPSSRHTRSGLDARGRAERSADPSCGSGVGLRHPPTESSLTEQRECLVIPTRYANRC